MSVTTTILREDAQDLNDPEAGASWRRMPRSFTTRRQLKLTVEEFSARYRISADTLRAWEAGTEFPDAVADAYLLAIASEPEMVAKALEKARRGRETVQTRG